MRRICCLLACTLSLVAAEVSYQKPSKEILDILNAPVFPSLGLNPSRTYASLAQAAEHPSIAEVSEPMLRLAGLRINPRTNGIHLAPYYTSLILIKLADATKTAVALPPHAKAGSLRWSPDGNHFAFTNTLSDGIELWVGEPVTGKVRRIDGVRLNSVLGEPIDWMPDNRTILLKTVPTGRKAAPAE